MTRKQNTIRLLAALSGCLLLSLVARAGHYTVPLLVPAGASSDPLGVLRILNATDESGKVEIYAIDDSGTLSGPATFMLNAAAAVEFTATDLQSGNTTLGLSGGIGTEPGDSRLRIETELQIVPLAFVRAADGTLSAMHDTVRGATDRASGQYRYQVPLFNPSTEMTQVSRLRLINPADAAATVTISARDDSGAAATGGDVTLSLAPGGAKTLTARQLESGDRDVTGRLGAGTGKWRLTVTADRPLQVMNAVAASAGYWNNLSTTAVPGSAPADLEALNERFVGNAVVYETRGNRFTLNAMAGARYTETAEVDGFTATFTGSYRYAAIGPDTGRLTLMYDDGGECGANLHFAALTSGWFASHCTGSEHPAEGTWLGGNWFIEDDSDDSGEVSRTTYGVGNALPGVPTSGAFHPAQTSGGGVVTTDGGYVISLNENGYFELDDGMRYTCTAPGGCTIANGTVTAGTITGRARGSGEVDRFPSFRDAVGPGNLPYTVDTAIDSLTLPPASGGNGVLSYSLSPSVPGLVFSAAVRQLTGTPTTSDTYTMTYTVTDEDGDTDTLVFTITVSGSLGDCHAGLMVGIGQSCTYPGTAEEFSVNVRGRGSFLVRLAGIRIRVRNETIDGRSYYFEASHQGEGVWRIDRVGDTSPSFAEDAGPGDQTYTAGTAIGPLTLPGASGGDGTLEYELSPNVPGLSFDPATLRLTGTPTRAGMQTMVYTVTDADGDSDTLSFGITVQEPDTTPEFEPGAGPGNQSYTRGTAIAPLSLPSASGGNGDLGYSLVPDVPGLNFDPTARRLTGTPGSTGTYPMTYSATDADGDSDSLSFEITVLEARTTGGGLAGGSGDGSNGGGYDVGGGGGGGSGGGDSGGGDSGGGDGIVPGSTFADPLASGGSGPVMVVIPAGSFRMGCVNDEECTLNQFPVHTVNVPRFALSIYEVTFEQWDACVDAGGCDGYRPYDKGWGRGDLPAIHIDWHAAKAYVTWLSRQTGHHYRLPTESEWEYAARAGTETKYYWGGSVGVNRANCKGCGGPWDGSQTAPVGSFGPNPWGLYDMHGNVWEWTEDCRNGDYTGAPTDGSAWRVGDCRQHVLRSGSWDNGPWYLRAAYSATGDLDLRTGVIGLRVARSLPR